MSTLNAALAYRSQLSYSVIPVGPDKKPLVKWEQFQKRLATEQEIRDWWAKNPTANVGIVTGIISGLAVIDLDDVPIAKAALAALVPDSLIFPVVKTPSGGEHWYFACTDGNIGNNTKIIPGADLRANGGYVVAPPSVNGNGKAWRWHDSLKPSKVPLPFLPVVYKEYIYNNNNKMYSSSFSTAEYIYNNNNKEYIYNNNNKEYIYNNNNTELTKSKKIEVSTNVHKMFERGTRDNDLFHVANHLLKGRMPIEETYQVLEKLALSCNPPFELSEIPLKIESAIKRQSAKISTLAQDVEDWVLSTNGNFLSSDIYKCLQLSTRDEHKNTSMILKRLANKGIIEKWGNKNGSWRLIDSDAENINWFNADIQHIKIKWPLAVEDFVLTMPKNIIVVAGVPNAGKTAFLLNVVADNMDSFNIHYFSSEMGAMEMKSRLQKFDFPLSKWRFTAKERADNFDEVIQPDDINIIDFLEITEDFYRVAGKLKAIYNKLNKGIAIIALQKNPGAMMARGGVGTLEKARLYLTIDNHILKLEKGKNWARENSNPNGQQIRFKLAKGCQFHADGDWYVDLMPKMRGPR